jgi:ribosomal protein L11
MQIRHIIYLYIYSQGADATPPLGTVLGNLGINSTNFCKEFNSFTADLPSYIKLTVKIIILSNRTYKFEVFSPSLGSLISRLGGKTVEQQCISLKSIVQLALFKFPKYPLKVSLPVLFGMIKSCNLIIL